MAKSQKTLQQQNLQKLAGNKGGSTGSQTVTDTTLAALPASLQAAIKGAASTPAVTTTPMSAQTTTTAAAPASTPATPAATPAATTPTTTPATQTPTSVNPSITDAIASLVLSDPNDQSQYGLTISSPDEYSKLQDSYDKLRSGLGQSIDSMNAANASLLKGEIPADVAAQLREQVSQSSIAGGLFGGGARSLTARDLGQTSLGIQQQGLANQANIAGMQDTAAKLDEAKRQFNKQYDLSVNNFRESVRAENLQGISLELSRQEFNSKMNLDVMNSMLDLVKQQQSLGFQYAQINADPGGMADTYDNWINALRGLLTQ